MTIKWPALKASLEPHTVEARGGRMAGFLVRCTASRKELGYVWKTGNVWRWRTPDDHSGERTSQRAAVEVLRDAHDLRSGATKTPPLPFDVALEESAKLPKRQAKPTPEPKPKREAPKPVVVVEPEPEPPPAPKPPQRIVWSDQPSGDLTKAVADALRRRP